jgi:hypothetical protein
VIRPPAISPPRFDPDSEGSRLLVAFTPTCMSNTILAARPRRPGPQPGDRPDQDTPGPPPPGPRFPFAAESGNGDSPFPARFPIPANQETGNPRFPRKTPGNRGNPSREPRLLLTRNILSREHHAVGTSASALTSSMRLLFRVRDSERDSEHAAVSDDSEYQPPRQWTQPRVSCSDRQHAAQDTLFRVRDSDPASE